MDKIFKQNEKEAQLIKDKIIKKGKQLIEQERQNLLTSESFQKLEKKLANHDERLKAIKIKSKAIDFRPTLGSLID